MPLLSFLILFSVQCFILLGVPTTAQSLQPTVRNLSYLLSVLFIKEFPSKDRIIVHLYLCLLRSTQPDGKQLVCQALDVLVPVLPKRIEPTDTDPIPSWVMRTRSFIIQEMGSPLGLSHVLSMICRHPAVFFPYRRLFVQTMLNCMSRTNMLGASLDSRSLAVDLAELIVSWARMHQEQEETATSSDLSQGL